MHAIKFILKVVVEVCPYEYEIAVPPRDAVIHTLDFKAERSVGLNKPQEAGVWRSSADSCMSIMRAVASYSSRVELMRMN